jgi:ribosome-associated protein
MMEWTMTGDYIQIDQLLKKYDLISSGGAIRPFLESHEVLLNGQPVHEKRKKIRAGDKLSIDGDVYLIRGE